MSAAADYAFIPASGAAARIAEGYWELRAPAAAETERIAPDGCCEMVFHLGAAPEEARNGGFARQPDALFYGPLTRALTLRRSGALHIRAVRFRPWGAAALARGLDGLRDCGAQARDAFGDAGERLAAAAREAADLPAFAARAGAIIETALRGGEDPGRGGFAGFIAALAHDPAADLAELERRSGYSQRSLVRLFRARLGLTPGEYLRILRFQRARAAVKGGPEPLGLIAAGAGYADQAHMTRDFARFASETPGAMRRAAALFDPLYQDASPPAPA
ncbi:MAG: helix-turn-helix transcriptional regulator [Maricaulaceae bacterium]|nr:helix-turn-helix transcriptional regulator [Maricaulaceae bacterium]